MSLTASNPATAKEVRTYPEMSSEEAEEAIAQAHEAWLAWRGTSFEQRARPMTKLASVLRARSSVLARLMAAIAAAMMILVAWQSAVVAFDQWDELMASMDASAAWFIVAVGVGSGHSALHLLWIALTGKPTMTEPVATE